MSKFDRVLSDDFFDDLGARTAYDNWVGFGRKVEQAVLAKLAEQEPVAFVSSESFSSDGTSDIMSKNLKVGTKLYAHPMPSLQQEPVFYISDKVLNNKTGKIDSTVKNALTWSRNKCQSWSVPLYTHPIPCVSNESDKAACVSESGESETQESEPFTPKTVSEMRSFIGMRFDSLQYANPETEEPDEMDRYTLTIHDLLSAFGWAGHYDCDYIAGASKIVGLDHIPDAGKMITGNQYGSIGESQAKIISAVQNYADKRVMAVYGNAGEIEVHEAYWNLAERIQAELEALQENSNHIADKRKMIPEGFQLVPIEPAEEMHLAARDWSVKMYGKAIGFEASHGCYKAMLSAAPKYTGEK